MKHILKCHEIVKTDFVRGQGCYVYDAHDKCYVDFESGIWCTALGHNHPRINQVIQTQVEKIIHLGTCYPSELAEEAAEKVLSVASLLDGKCVFLSSGSEAVEFGVQVTRRIMGKPLLLTFTDSYLAAYGSAGEKSPDEWYCFDWSNCAVCPHTDTCDPQCSSLISIPFDKIGGMVFEPGNSHGLVKFPPTKLVQTLAKMVKQGHGFIVTNEITTGMGRTGAWFGFQHYDLKPDIIAIGKGLGNGYPVSAVALKRDVARRLEESEFRYAQSHQNDPLGCAVAKEVITVLQEEGLVARSSEVGSYFLCELEQLAKQYPIIRDVRGRGLMIAIELDSSRFNSSVTSIYTELMDQGFLVGYTPSANLLRFYPGLIIGEDDINSLLLHLNYAIRGRMASGVGDLKPNAIADSRER